MPETIVDLRSDTVTVPCAAMRKAMATAEVGDDVYDEDPTVQRLEKQLAEMSGHQAGLYFPSGTQSNLVALLSHCQRGEEYIVGQDAHTYKFEGGGAAVLGSIQPQPIENEADGSLPLDKIRAAIKADDFHFPITRLLTLENTIGGKVLDQDYIGKAGELARQHAMKFHLDGARVFNAAVAQNLDVDAITRRFDSVSICLSKGLGAPVGSVLVSDSDFIHRAKRWRKMVGGGMRQVGIIAAAGQYAIDNNIQRLADDHELAGILAEQLAGVDGLSVRGNTAHTNMVYLTVDDGSGDLFRSWCAERGILFGGRDAARLVVHKDVDRAGVKRAAEVIRGYFAD